MKEKEPWLIEPQPRLGTVGVIFLLLVGTLLGPLSSDMYTPAIPHMVDYFHTSAGVVNLTLVVFFGFNAVGLLAFGPISDKMGRRPVLFAGVAVYLLGSLLCATSISIYMLIISRILQATGAGAVGAIGTAITKDAITPQRRELALTVVNTLFVLGPVAGPIVGAGVMTLFSWRAIFWVTVVLGLITLVLTICLRETLPLDQRKEDKLVETYKGLAHVCEDKGFFRFLLITCLFDIGFMAYIAVGSYVYIDTFGTTDMQYSYFFAANGLLTSVGPSIWIFVSKHTNIGARRYTTILMCVAMLSGVGILLFGHVSPFLFCLIFTLLSLTESGSRSYTINILLAQHEGETGAAASVINFLHTIMGCVAMLMALLPWPSYIAAVGGCEVVSIGISMILWVRLTRSGIKIKGLQ